jgi:hypothetical protein
MEPNVDLLRPKRFRLQHVIVILGLCVFAIWMLWPSSRPHHPPRPAPPVAKPAVPPLYVSVVPEENPGWCCVAGKVSAASRAACKGTFFTRQEEAKRLCPTAPSGSPRGRGTGA